jgi:hypothetical protein
VSDPAPHLQDRRDDWADATDDEWADALLDMPALIDPLFMAYAKRHRPEALRRALLLHESLGGYLGTPARAWLATRKKETA